MVYRPGILIVDDQAFTHTLIRKALGNIDADIVSVLSGEEAIEAASTRNFSLILMDLMMPGMNGLETAQRIREIPRSKPLPFIFISAVSDVDQYAEQAYELGAVDFLHKPLSPAALRSKVHMFTELDRQHRALEQRHEQYRDILEAIATGIITFDLNWRVREANQTACEMFGYPHDMFIGMELAELAETDPDTLYEELDGLLEHNVAFRVVIKAKRASGSKFDLELRGGAFLYAGEPHVLVVSQDVTNSVCHQEALAAHQERINCMVDEQTADLQAIIEELKSRNKDGLFTLLASANAAIVITNADTGKITHVNAVAEDMFASQAEPLINRPIEDALCPTEDGERCRFDIPQTSHVEHYGLKSKDGAIADVALSLFPVEFMGESYMVVLIFPKL